MRRLVVDLVYDTVLCRRSGATTDTVGLRMRSVFTVYCVVMSLFWNATAGRNLGFVSESSNSLVLRPVIVV